MFVIDEQPSPEIVTAAKRVEQETHSLRMALEGRKYWNGSKYIFD